MYRPNVSLHCHLIELRPVREEQPQYAQRLAGGQSVLTVLDAGLNGLTATPKNDEQSGAHLSLSQLIEQDNPNLICGILDSGRFGMAGDVKDVDTNALLGRISRRHTVPLGLFFMFYAPPDSLRCFLVLQRFQNHGVSSDFLPWLYATIRGALPQVPVTIESVIIARVWQDYFRHGAVKEFVFRTAIPERDDAEGIDMQPHEGLESMEVTYKPRRGFRLGGIIDMVGNRNTGVRGILTYLDPTSQFAPTEGAIVVKKGSSSKTIDMQNPAQMNSYYDITDQIHIDDDGHPVLADVMGATKEYLREILREQGMESTHV